MAERAEEEEEEVRQIPLSSNFAASHPPNSVLRRRRKTRRHLSLPEAARFFSDVSDRPLLLCEFRTECLLTVTMDDQKRRTLEALERRFAQSKSEIENKQHKTKKRPIEVEDKVANIESSNADSTSKKPRLDASAIKGNFSFFGPENKPAYFKLSHPVHKNLLPNGVEVSDGKVTVNRVLHELLQHGDAAHKYIQGSKSLKIENTILLDNFVQKSGMSSGDRNRALQNASKRSKKHMSLKQHKISGSFNLHKEFDNFKTFKPMHDKWKGYIQQLLKINQLAQCFLNADLHGAIIRVVQCKTVSYVGTRGIMVRETKETFGIITQGNKFRVVPKRGSVFVLQADCWKITMHGDKLASRNLIP
ncbi:hypothetical protein CASFOL_017087 [Castilleja foliolosa]|uniref:Uncharacterized protein n=1 Tax=Castilleja foliolosa TaxID=1961234 RepID=A0ABD3DA22_9LAMI